MGHAAVLEATAEERDLEALALVQGREGRGAVGRRVGGDEQDGLQRSASS